MDTLYLGFRTPLRFDVVEALEAKRKRLCPDVLAPRASANVGDAVEEHSAAGSMFALKPVAQHGYRYRLVNDDLALILHPCPPATMPSVRAQLRSSFLWREGWQGAVALVRELAAELLDAARPARPPIVSRLDLCADFQGWIPTAADVDRFVTRAKSRSAHQEGGAFTGLCFGRGSLHARLYNKTAELAVSGKEWMRALWEQRDYAPSDPVWRLEFELHREVLRELGVDTVDELNGHLGQVWRYGTTKWLRLAVPAGSEHRERWPTDPAWERLLSTAFDSVGGVAMRARKQGGDLDKTLAMVAGGLTSVAARLGLADLDDVLAYIGRCVEHRLRSNGLEFRDLAARKARSRATLR